MTYCVLDPTSSIQSTTETDLGKDFMYCKCSPFFLPLHLPVQYDLHHF